MTTELDTLRKQLAENRDKIESLWVTVEGLREENAKAQATITALREALAFYADGWEGYPGDSGPGGNWPADPECWPGEALQEDAGNRARQALAATEPQAEKGGATFGAGVKAAAEIARKHKGSAASKRRARGQQFKFLDPNAVLEIEAEERGEDIASEIIEREILALLGKPKDTQP